MNNELKIYIDESFSGLNLLDILNKKNHYLYAPCGGVGKCWKCKVKVSGDISDLTELEKNILTLDEISNGIRLACVTYLQSTCTLYLPDSVENNSKLDINAPALINCYQSQFSRNIDENNNISFYELEKEIYSTNDPSCEFIYGIALDLGSTTIACYLVNLITGEQVYVLSSQNPQCKFGSDVISRINYSIEANSNLDELTKLTRETINNTISSICKKNSISTELILKCVLVGNSVMHHIFFNYSLKSLSQIPFEPINSELHRKKAKTVGVDINSNAELIFLQLIGGYVGADTVGCLIGCDILELKDKNILLLDIGTNGEIVLIDKKGKGYACSTAAGPSFEGHSIECGMQAFSGAVSEVAVINGTLEHKTIDNATAKGICGSGLIDIISLMCEYNIIDDTGRFSSIDDIELETIKNLISEDKFYISKTDNVYISQKDVRQMQLAKSAISTGIDILIKSANLTYEDIDYLYLAGAFGNYINIKNAHRIGLFSKVFVDIIKPVGNAAGVGAKNFLINETKALEKLNLSLSNMTHKELAHDMEFQSQFVSNLHF